MSDLGQNNISLPALDLGLHVGALLELIPVAIYVIDSDYRVRLWNRAAERVYGWSAAEIIGCEPLFIPDCDEPSARLIWKNAKAGIHISDLEATRQSKSGRVVQISASSSTLMDVHGQFVGILISAVDVSEHASLAILLGSRIDFMRHVLDAMPNAVYFKDLEGRYQGFNAAYEQLFGVNRQDGIGKTVYDIFDIDDAHLRAKQDQHLITERKPLWFDDSTQRGSEKLSLQHHKALFYGENNEPAGIVGVLTDTTRLRAAYEYNVTVEERLALALQASNQGLWDHDHQSNIVTIDKTVQSWGNYQSERMHVSDLFVKNNPLNPARLREDVLKLLKGENEFFETEIIGISASGESRVIRLKGRVTRWSTEGRALRSTGTATDVTEEKVRAQYDRLRDQKLKVISENVDELILLVDLDGEIVFKTESAAHWFDTALIRGGMKLDDFVHVDDLALYRSSFASVAKDVSEISVRIRTRAESGVYRFADLNLKRIVGDEADSGSIVIVGRDVTDRIELDLRLEKLAHYDQLTGVANRTLLRDRAEHAICRAKRFKGLVGVVFIDLDDFKRVNDSYGHAAGDELLKTVAARLKVALRTSDTVARQGGDEFILLLEDLQSVSQAKVIGKRVLEQFVEPIDLGVAQVEVGASIGIALYPDDGLSIDELFGQADAAMYQAKASGKKRIEFFTSDIRNASIKRAKLEAALVNAITENQMSLVYQPQIDLRTGNVIGAEALLRWNHPELGSISPLEFIPIAEDTGAILAIGDWVLSQACHQVARWQALGYPALRIAVNVSSRQWRQSDIALKVAQVLGETGLPAQQLELELTESVMMKDLESSMVTMRWLKSMGVTFALDDFGTGYSSLSYLKRFEVDIVKIDRSFTRDLPDDLHDVAIVKAILAMASGLDIQVIAEGIESAEQMEFLKSYGCQFGQGYFIAMPLTPLAFEAQFLKPILATNASKEVLSLAH